MSYFQGCKVTQNLPNIRAFPPKTRRKCDFVLFIGDSEVRPAFGLAIGGAESNILVN